MEKQRSSRKKEGKETSRAMRTVLKRTERQRERGFQEEHLAVDVSRASVDGEDRRKKRELGQHHVWWGVCGRGGLIYIAYIHK
jgi:hypothetical protein